jgi:hypothetical protein
MIHGDACFAYFNKIWGILNFPSTNILGCCGLLYGPRLPGFGVLHSVLRDETTVFHTQSASEQAQLVNIAIAVR